MADDKTWKNISVIKECFPHFIVENIIIKRIDLKDANLNCVYCDCYRKNAVLCLSQVFNFYFDHIEHDPPQKNKKLKVSTPASRQMKRFENDLFNGKRKKIIF